MTPLVLYHRTTIGQGTEAVRHGFRDEEWTFGVRGSRARDEDKIFGVWVTDRPLKEIEGPPGDAVLEVKLDLRSTTPLSASMTIGISSGISGKSSLMSSIRRTG